MGIKCKIDSGKHEVGEARVFAFRIFHGVYSKLLFSVYSFESVVGGETDLSVHMCVLGEGQYLLLYNRITIGKDSQVIIWKASPKPTYTE